MGRMASRILSNFTNLITVSILVFLSEFAFATASITNTKNPHEAFLQCFLSHTCSNSTTQVIYTPDTSSYGTILRSSVQNLRYLSPSTTKPAFIIVPANPSHVQATVTCGKAHSLHVRTRSGGHDHEGLSYASAGDPFVLLDLVNLRSVSVDASTSTAWVEAGATVGELYYGISIVTKNKTLAFPAATYPTVGVGGLFSGGGIGTLLRKYGTSADNIVDALVVDANGNLLTRKTMGEDLFWAIRGGGASSFCIVISYKIRLVYVPSTVAVFRVDRDLSQGVTKVVERWQHVAPKLDDNFFVRLLTMAINDNVGGKVNRTIRAWIEGLFLGSRCGDLLSILEKRFPELRVEAKDCTEMSWLQSTLFFAQGYSVDNPSQLLDRRPQRNSSTKAKSDFVKKPITEKGWERIWKLLLEAKDQRVGLILEPWGGRMEEIPEDAVAFPHRKGNLYNLQYFMRWFETEEAATRMHLKWMRKLYRFMTPYVSKNPRAAYLNMKDLDLGRNDEGKTSYAKASVWGRKYFLNNFERLARVKARVDPDDYFWNEQSIPPLFA
ncbi:berberine bridge enzyme-like 18 [Elaeis guineensis]|uniref:Berberine bridge enzyme-like 18 n=1 Tax=Elaeis guineensis var. tenera TaxID=51953 RepID=A0A6I9QB27_ELAGV|nr:berberine bridge enzyme-like 18 [Elaeis guineensis]